LPPDILENLPPAPDTPVGWPKVDNEQPDGTESVQQPQRPRSGLVARVATQLVDSLSSQGAGDKSNKSSSTGAKIIGDDDGQQSVGTDETAPEYMEDDDDEWADLQKRAWIDLPFELQSVDAVLHTVCLMLFDESNELEQEASVTMEQLLHSTTAGGGGDDVLRTLKNDISQMQARVQGFTRALNLVLDEDEDLALMNLSRLITHPERFIQPVPEEVLHEESDEPELILEGYLQQAMSTANVLGLLKEELLTIEGLMNMRLDTIRNRLLYINTIVSILALCVAVGSFVGSLFGMNLYNHMEDNPDRFRQVVLATCFGILALLLFLFMVFWRAGIAAPLFV
jgi:magnesium transporter